MAEQILDRPAEAWRAASEIGNGLVPSAPALIPGWRCLPGAVIRAHGEEGPVDLAALHPARGVALIAFLDEGQEASPAEARDALRAMLGDEGLQRRFPGELPIVALPVPRAARARLAATVEHAFSGMPAPTLPAGWVDWLAERLAAERPSAAPRLLAPCRDEPTPDSEIATPAGTPPLSEPEPRHNWLDWGATLGFALGMVAALIAGLAALLRNGRLF